MTQTKPLVEFHNVSFTEEDIIACNVMEDFNPISITIPTNVMDLTLYAAKGGFTIINPSGVYEPLLSRQPLIVSVIIDGQKHFVGQYYVDEWENEGEHILHFRCIDNIGLLENEKYMGGLWLSPVLAGEILEDIFDTAGLDVFIDDEIYNTEITGWLPISSCRDAVQQICFATGAYVRSNRQKIIKIGKMGFVSRKDMGIRAGVSTAGQSRTYQMRWRGNIQVSFESTGVPTAGIRSGVSAVGQSRKWQKRWRTSQWEGTEYYINVPNSVQSIDRTLTLQPKVTEVQVPLHDILEGEGERTLFDGELDPGEYIIEFNQPMHTLSAENATISGNGANYAILQVPTTDTVKLSGLTYIDTISVYSIKTPMSPQDKSNVMKVESSTLINSTNGKEVAQRIFDYYQQRYFQKFRLFGSTLSAGNLVELETLYGNILYGVVEHTKLDLANGSIAECEVVGFIV